MTERYIEKQKEFCELYKIDFNEVERLNSKVISLFENGLRRTALIAIKDAYSDVNQNMNYWSSIWHLSNDKKTKPEPQQKSLLDLFLYLLLVEGIYSKLVQIITFLLMENDHDLYDPLDMKFVKDYKKLDKVSLFVKLKFLSKHEFDLIANSVKRELRNCIAHIDVIVKDDGSIINKRSVEVIINLPEITDYLGGVIAVTLNVMEYALIKIGAVDPPAS